MKTTDAPLYSTHLVNPFDVLTKAEKSLIYSAHNFMAFKKNQYLFRSGEPVKGIYCIKKGAVKVTQNHGQRTITLRFVSTGEWVGHRSIFTSDNYQGTAKARLETQAYFISESLLLSLLIQNKTFAYQFIKKIIKALSCNLSKGAIKPKRMGKSGNFCNYSSPNIFTKFLNGIRN